MPASGWLPDPPRGTLALAPGNGLPLWADHVLGVRGRLEPGLEDAPPRRQRSAAQQCPRSDRGRARGAAAPREQRAPARAQRAAQQPEAGGTTFVVRLSVFAE